MDHAVDRRAGLDVSGPAGERDHARAALVKRALALAVRPVVAGHDHLRLVALAREHRVARAAVVAVEDDQRVLAQLLLVERLEHAPDLLVHRVDHGGVGAPARLGDVLVLVEVLLRRLVGRVRRVERQVEVEGLRRVALADVLDRLVADQRRRVALLLERLVVLVPVEHAVLLVREVVDLADQRPVLVVEAALFRPVLAIGVAEVPLADDRGLVAGFLERLRQRHFVRRQSVETGRRNHERLQPVAERIAPRHQARARRRAEGLHVELRELRAGRRELVDVRRADVRAVEAHVLPAEIVGEDVEDVRLARGGSRTRVRRGDRFGSAGDERNARERGAEGEDEGDTERLHSSGSLERRASLGTATGARRAPPSGFSAPRRA